MRCEWIAWAAFIRLGRHILGGRRWRTASIALVSASSSLRKQA
jgi:hypothetical protein